MSISSSRPWLLGGVSAALLILNTAFWCIPFYVIGLAKVLVPVTPWRRACARLLVRLAEGWVTCNGLLLDRLHDIEWDVRGVDQLDPAAGNYLVVSNHQTWADIPVLQRTLNRRIPFLKFFLKRELIWVPLLGPAWWFLDFPFMKRYPRETLERRPELRYEDLETTRRACEKFRAAPVSILNFLEGTRFTPAKHAAQRSPYPHLLAPKAGGVAFVLGAMGPSIRLLDVTIVYPDGAPDFWDFLAARLRRVIVSVQEKPIPADLFRGDYLGDAAFRSHVQSWVQQLWDEKEQTIARLLAESRRSRGVDAALPSAAAAG